MLPKINIYNTNKNIYILFYANWCGYCRDYKPKWDLIKEKYKNSDNITLIEISDEDYNDIITNKSDKYDDNILNIAKSLKINGFPTVYSVLNGETNQIDRNIILNL
jgi:thiol-disulfide isomerase/thioredoxin